MKYIDYKERRKQGTFSFPIAYYHQTPHSPRYHMPCHWHTHCEIIHFLSGTFHMTLDNSSHLYKEGDIIFISDGVLHGGTPNDCIYDCIVFDLQILMKDNHACAQTLQDIMNHRILIDTFLSASSSHILPLMQNLCAALSGKKEGYEFMTQGYLYQLLGIILEEHLYQKQDKNPESAQQLKSIKNALSYISQNYCNTITLEDLAKIAGMNPKYFCRYFRSMTERTPIDYLNYYRIECACEMLSTKNLSIKETAICCGFNDESYFIKTFHKYKGTTPKQFLKTRF